MQTNNVHFSFLSLELFFLSCYCESSNYGRLPLLFIKLSVTAAYQNNNFISSEKNKRKKNRNIKKAKNGYGEKKREKKKRNENEL